MNDPVVFRGRARLLRRNWALLAASVGAGAAGVLALMAADTYHGLLVPFLGVLGVIAMFASPFVSAYVWFASPHPRLREGDLVTGPDGVEHAGRRVVARRSIRAGFTVPRGSTGVLVQLERRFRRPIELLVPSAEDARDVLKSLGLDASQTAASVPLRSLATLDWRRYLPGLSLLAFLGGSLLVVLLFKSPLLMTVVAASSLLSFVAGIVMLSLKGRATVAADGVLVTFLWERRFYPYASIARVVPTFLGYKTVALVMKNGRSVHLPIPRQWSHEQEITAAERLTSRIRSAMAEHRAAPGEADLAALARRDRPARAWVVHLLGIGAGANADHRRAPVPADRLWRIVESPTEGAEARAAAAVALGASRDERTRDRIRAIAGNTALPALRIALEAAAGASDDEQAAEEEIAAALELLPPGRS